MKKLLKAVLVLCIAASVATVGCKNGGASKSDGLAVKGSDSAPGWKANKDKPITFDWYINFSWFSRQWGESVASKYITEQTGVNVRFIAPAGNESEKLNSMIAGDALPDLITLDWNAVQITEMINSGLVLPLDELAKDYDPYFFKVANPQKLGWYRQDDGHVYGYPNASYTPQDYVTYKGKIVGNETFLVRKDMYEALGKPDMSTPEGFLKALRAAKAKFPTVNGQPLLPFGLGEFLDNGNLTLQRHLEHFLAVPYEKDGQFVDQRIGNDDADYVRWLKTFRQASQEGLLPTDAFIDKRSQIEEKAGQGRYFAMLYQSWDMQASQMALYNKDPNSIYIAIDPPRNLKRSEPQVAGGGVSGWCVTLISKKCKDKARAIQFLTYLISEEGQMATNFGVKDVTYAMTDGKPDLLPEIRKIDQSDKNLQETKYGIQYTYWMLMDTAWQQQWNIKYSPALEQPQLWTRPYVTSFAVCDNMTFTAGSDEDVAFNEIQSRWAKDLPRLLTAKSDGEFDKVWKEFQDFKMKAGYDKLQKAQTAIMLKNKEKLGLK